MNRLRRILLLILITLLTLLLIGLLKPTVLGMEKITRQTSGSYFWRTKKPPQLRGLFGFWAKVVSNLQQLHP
jgi:hypothetical protein